MPGPQFFTYPPPPVPTGSFPVVDSFVGTVGGSLGSHLSDNGTGWHYDGSGGATASLTGSGQVAAATGLMLALSGGVVPAGTEVVATLVVTRLSTASARMGPLVRLVGGVGLLAWYDSGSDQWGLSAIAGGVAVDLTTTAAGLAVGSSTQLILWASGRLATLSADGTIVLMAILDLPSQQGGFGMYAAGANSAVTGCLGSHFAAYNPRVSAISGYDPGTYHYLDTYIAQAISAIGVTTAGNSFISIEPEPFPFGGLPMAVVRPGQAVENALMPGGGRTYGNEDYQFSVMAVGMNYADIGGRDDYGVTDPNDGISVVSRKILDILQLTWPRSPQGDYLTQQPLTLRGGNSPERTYRKMRSWRACDLTGSVPISTPLTVLD